MRRRYWSHVLREALTSTTSANAAVGVLVLVAGAILLFLGIRERETVIAYAAGGMILLVFLWQIVTIPARMYQETDESSSSAVVTRSTNNISYLGHDHDHMPSYKSVDSGSVMANIGLLLLFSNEPQIGKTTVENVTAWAAYYGEKWQLLQFQQFQLHWQKHSDIASWHEDVDGVPTFFDTREAEWFPEVDMPPNGQRFWIRIAWLEAEEHELIVDTPRRWYFSDIRGDYSRRFMFPLGDGLSIKVQLYLHGLPGLAQRYWFEIGVEPTYPFVWARLIDAPPHEPVWPQRGTQNS